MNNDSNNVNGTIIDGQQPVGNVGIVTNPTPEIPTPEVVQNPGNAVENVDSAVQSNVTTPVPNVVDSSPIVDNSVIAPTVSIPTVEPVSVDNQVNADTNNNVGETVVNQNPVIIPDAVPTVDNTGISDSQVPVVDQNVGLETAQGMETGVGAVPDNTVMGQQTVSTPNVAQTTNQVTDSPVVNDDGNVTKVVSIGKYLGYIFLFSIPLIGFIMLIVKICDKKDKNISNFAKAILVYSVIVTVVCSIFGVLAFKSIEVAIKNFFESADVSVSTDDDATITTDNSFYNNVVDDTTTSTYDDENVVSSTEETENETTEDDSASAEDVTENE